jgi:hypothetical protein
MNKPNWLRGMLDQWAERSSRPVNWRDMMGVIGFGLFMLGVIGATRSIGPDGPVTLEQWVEVVKPIGLLIAWIAFLIHLRNRHDMLRYYREVAGMDPYDRAAVKADRERIKQEIRDRYGR